jgi:hypothetical protein
LRIERRLQKLLGWTYETAIIKAVEVIEEEMAKTSPDTGHGKAQRAFARKLLERLRHE